MDRLRGMAADMNATETLTREDLAGAGPLPSCWAAPCSCPRANEGLQC